MSAYDSFLKTARTSDPAQLVEQNREFIRRVTTPDGQHVQPGQEGSKLSQRDLTYLNGDERAVRRATDPDRPRTNHKDPRNNRAEPRTIDKNSSRKRARWTTPSARDSCAR